jgi:hypothetical protein
MTAGHTPRDSARRLREWRRLMLSTDGPDNHEGKLVAIAIAEKVDWEAFNTTVGAETIARETKLCERTVRNRIQELIRDGFLSAQPVGHGRRWKLRELTLRWPVRHAGHEDSRPAPGTGHEGSRPACGNAMTGMRYSHDRHGVHPISSETNIEITPEGSAASPSPANAGSAAPDSEAVEVIRDLYRKGFKPTEIWERYCKRRGMTLAQVQAVTNDLDGRQSSGPARACGAPENAK